MQATQAVSCQAPLESALRRLQHTRTPYRFYVLRFSARLSEALVARLVQATASHAYHIRIDAQSFGVLDITKDHHEDHEEDIFLQDLMNRLEEQYRRLSGTGWMPVVVDSIEGQTDEIAGVEDLLLLTVSRIAGRAEPVQERSEDFEPEYLAFG